MALRQLEDALFMIQISIFYVGFGTYAPRADGG